MKNFCYLLFALALLAFPLTSCQTMGNGSGGGYRDSVNDSSLYRSQDRTFRSVGR